MCKTSIYSETVLCIHIEQLVATISTLQSLAEKSVVSKYIVIDTEDYSATWNESPFCFCQLLDEIQKILWQILNSELANISQQRKQDYHTTSGRLHCSALHTTVLPKPLKCVSRDAEVGQDPVTIVARISHTYPVLKLPCFASEEECIGLLKDKEILSYKIVLSASVELLVFPTAFPHRKRLWKTTQLSASTFKDS